MYVAQRYRFDLSAALAFLCTRVDRSTEQDSEKLRRLLTYMNNTKYDFLTIGAVNIEKLLTFVDVSFAVNQDMRSHSFGGVSFGKGFLLTRSTKQKVDTSSTTESDVFGASDYLPNTIWLMKFL